MNYHLTKNRGIFLGIRGMGNLGHGRPDIGPDKKTDKNRGPWAVDLPGNLSDLEVVRERVRTQAALAHRRKLTTLEGTCLRAFFHEFTAQLLSSQLSAHWVM